jgi:peptidoglycan/LPS O-acetylase OafA/YrhL
MGILRLLFALSVVIYHAGLLFNYNIANKEIAIFSFFIISGFYMALILDKKYTEDKPLYLFWSNRFLRIFPLYWLTLLLMVLFTLLKFFLGLGTEDNAITHYIEWSADTSSLYFIIDLINYIVRNISLILTIDYFRVNDSTPGYLLVQQAWTLQIELLFYLLAPFIVRLSKKTFIAVFLGYVVFFFGFIAPLHLLPQTLLYIFLSHLIFFLLGVASYQFVYQYIERKKLNAFGLKIIFSIFLLYVLVYNYIPLKLSVDLIHGIDILYYALLIIALPFIFYFTKKNTIDAFAGSLSYPVYITHFFILKLISNLPIFQNTSSLKSIIVIISTLFFSYILVKYIEQPINRIRQKRVKQSSHN